MATAVSNRLKPNVMNAFNAKNFLDSAGVALCGKNHAQRKSSDLDILTALLALNTAGSSCNDISERVVHGRLRYANVEETDPRSTPWNL